MSPMQSPFRSRKEFEWGEAIGSSLLGCKQLESSPGERTKSKNYLKVFKDDANLKDFVKRSDKYFFKKRL